MNIRISECIAPSFYSLHKMLKNDELSELWCKGGRGSTKSSFDSIEIIFGILKDPEANAVCFRKFENEIHDSVYSQLEWAAYTLGVHELFRWYKSPHKIMHIETGQLVVFKGADNPKKIKSIKLATGYIKYAWFEEVDQFGGMAELRNLMQSIFRGTTKKQIALFSFNPPKSARSWVNAECKIKKKGRVVHHSDYRNVPRSWLGDAFIENAEHLKETNLEAYKHEYLGEETGTGLEVFTNVTLRPITDKEISYFDYNFQGLDFGYTVDPLVFVQMSFDAKMRKLYIFFEISGVGMKYSKLTSDLSKEQLSDVTMADKANPKDIDDLREDYNMNVIGAEKPPGSVDHGIKWLQDLEEIVIDPVRCPRGASEFINYALNVTRFGDIVSKYPDKDNHCFIGSTMVSTLTGPRRIDQIKVGELVHTRQGLRPVKKVFMNGVQKVVTTKLLNGKSLTLTDTHNIITKKGDVLFKDLTPLDTVYYEATGCRFIETKNQKLQYLKVKNTEDIQRVREELTGYILKGQVQKEKIFISTWLSMKLRMERFLNPITYTIKMATLLIMKFLILSVLMAQSIYRIILRSTIKGIRILSEKTLTRFALLQKYGILPKRVEHGIQKWQRSHGKEERVFSLFVNNVEKSTKQGTRGIQDSAPMHVNQKQGVNRVLTMLKDSVQFVGKGLQSISTQKQNVAQENVQPVYDLEIDEVHEYFANGLLVHNCIDATRYAMVLQIMQAKAEKRKHKKKCRVIPVMNRW